MSAWLPPGLALGWLAILGTFVRGAGSLLAAWAGTVCLVVLLARRHRVVLSRSSPKAADYQAENPDAALTRADKAVSAAPPDPTPNTPDIEDGAQGGSSDLASATDAPTMSVSREPGHGSGRAPSPDDRAARATTGNTLSNAADQAPLAGIEATSATPRLRVLTAAEVALVLRIDADIIITAIGNGELPGNRIGSHWRVDESALAHWLQGAYEGPRRSRQLASDDGTQQ